MRGMDDVDEELQRGFGLSTNELEPLLRVGGDAAEMKFMECCRYLWQADGAELTEPFIEAVFNKLPEKSLKRYRSRGDQTVRVEHVTVNEGGQAIVGNVAHRGGGNGDDGG